MRPVTLARHAMATRFELVLHGDNPTGLRAAGEEAFEEIDRLENQLSLYRPGSEIAQVNSHAAREAVRVTPPVFGLLQQAKRISEETCGAFDITIAPLVRCWGFMNSSGKMPAPEEIAEARAKVGMQFVHLDERNRTVRFAREGVMLDLGAIGKGYAVGQAAENLRAAGVTSALIHGGTSTAYAIGNPPDAECWKLAIEVPPAEVLKMTSILDLPAVSLRDEAMSVSTIWGRSFESGDQTFGHVIDPRTGQPVRYSALALVVFPSATETDALSTALLTLGSAGHESIAHSRPGIKTLLVARTENGLQLQAQGLDIQCAALS